MRTRINLSLIQRMRANPPSTRQWIQDDKQPGFVVRVSPTGRCAFYVAIDRNRRRRLTIGSAATPEQARERARIELARLATGAMDLVTPRAPRLSAYRRDVYDAEFSAEHRTSKALAALVPFIDIFGDVRLDKITPQAVQRWRTERLTAGTAPATVNRNVSGLKALLAHAVRGGVIAANPLTGFSRLRVAEENRVRYLTDAEEQRLRDALAAREERIRVERDSANAWRHDRGYEPLPDLRAVAFVDHLQPMVLLSLNTGARQGELFKLEWHEAQPALLSFTSEKTKSQRTRRIPLNAEARTTLAAWREQSGNPDRGYVFAARSGARMDNVKKAWQAVLASARIENFRWHDMRHHFASRLVMAAVPLNSVRELLGHSDLKMTLRYAHLAPGHLRDAVSVLDR